MKPLHIQCQNTIPSQCGLKYKGMAFDGCYFYLTCPEQCKIVKYNKCFCEENARSTEKPYTSICYDPKENCFWAVANNNSCKLFKLDLCFQEIDFLTLSPRENSGAQITGVTYDYCNDLLMVAFLHCIVTVDKCGNEVKEIISPCNKRCITGVLSISPSYIVTAIVDDKEVVEIYNGCGELKYCFDISTENTVETILFYPCADCCAQKYHFYILTNKDCCQSYLAKWVINPCEYKIDICGCNFLFCDIGRCDEACPTPPPQPPCHVCNDIIESIALIETSLSHILNAEGEKLQKIIASTNDVDKILCANKAINQTLVNATHLEIVLYNKLAAAKNCCPYLDDDCSMCKEFSNFDQLCEADVLGKLF
ncbi:MAG: hypothetical protein RR385_07315 [Clostridiales bacterium]